MSCQSIVDHHDKQYQKQKIKEILVELPPTPERYIALNVTNKQQKQEEGQWNFPEVGVTAVGEAEMVLGEVAASARGGSGAWQSYVREVAKGRGGSDGGGFRPK